MSDVQRALGVEPIPTDDVPTRDQRAVRVVWSALGTSALDDKGVTYTPPDGWFVDEVLPAFASNGAGVVFVLRQVL